MASIRKIGNNWRVELCVNGKRKAKTFARKTDASNWAIRQHQILQDASGANHTLRNALRRFATDESPLHKGARWETVRLAAFETLRHNLPLDKNLRDLGPESFARWRDDRLLKVKSSTVLREMALLGSVLETARRNWRWMEKNPLRDVRRPPQPKHRDITINAKQIKAILRASGYRNGQTPVTVTHRVMLAFLTALRTGMRAGEICALTWNDIVLINGQGYAILRTSKTGKGRNVPLTFKAVRYFLILKKLGTDKVFDLNSATLDTLFRVARKKANLSGFTFHDSRHTAATWIAGRLKSGDIPAQQALLDMCKIFGWSKTDRALTYYNPDPMSILERLS